MIWGVSFGSHNSAISVFENNELVFATDGERFSKTKNDKNLCNELLDFCGVPEKVFYYENPFLKSERRKFAGQTPELILPDFKYPLTYSNHHRSHASYGYYTSPYDDAIVLVLDAIGEWDTMSIWHVKDKNFKRMSSWKYPKSLGLMYSALTQAAGWKPNEEEYIMMGASSMPIEEDVELTEFIENKIKNNFNWHTGVEIPFDKNKIAFSAQRIYEKEFAKLTDEILTYSEYVGNLIFVGGCALNVKANAMLTKFDNVYIPSNPGDGGSAIGCVLTYLNKKINPSPYLGFEIPGKYPVDEIVSHLKENEVVGVMSGKAEFGPRALGNRSLFADPRVKNIKDKLNNIKGRELFRPFAPMILKENVDEYFYGGINSPYMNSIWYAKDNTKEKWPEVIHVDGTSRLQIVEDETHKHLLREWENETKCPMIINTSLNVKGQPIANDETDRRRCKNLMRIEIL